MKNGNKTKAVFVAITAMAIAFAILFSISLQNPLILFSPQKENARETIKIGAILPLTGHSGLVGQEIRRGIELATEEIKKEKDLDFETIFEDDQSFSTTALVNAANKLVRLDNVDIGFTVLVEESKPIAPIFNENKIPLMVLWDSSKTIGESGAYIFSNGFSTEKAGERMADFAYADLGLRQIAIIKHIDPWAETISNSFKTRFEELGGSIIYNESIAPDTTDFRTSILKIKSLTPSGVYFPLIPPNSSKFLVQAKQLGLNARLLTGDALIQDVIDKAGNAAEGVYFTNIYAGEETTLKLKQKYRNKYNTEPLDITLVSFGYGGVKKIEEALTKYPERPLGESLSIIFGPNHSMDKTEKIFAVQNGKPAPIE